VLLRWGTIGSFVLKLAIEREVGESAALDLVRSWAGDAYVLSRLDEAVCITAEIVMDEPAAAAGLASAIDAAMAPAVLDVSAATIHMEHCRDGM